MTDNVKPRSERSIVILAAGRGRRLGSEIDKALIDLAGISMLEHVVRASRNCDPDRIVVVRRRDQPPVTIADCEITTVLQDESITGTGAALIAARDELSSRGGALVVVFADNPLLRGERIIELFGKLENESAVLALTTALDCKLSTRGRVVRHDGRIVAVVEAATEELPVEQPVAVNCGAMALRADWAWDQLDSIPPDSITGELYLTDLVRLAAQSGQPIGEVRLSDPTEGIGCDDLASLAKAETAYFRRRALQLAKHGVRVVDLDSIQIHANVTVEPGAVIGPGAIIGGRTHIKTRARVGEGSQISDSIIAEGSTVISSRITDSQIGADARIGPNAFVRDGTRVGRGAQVGNCAEVKNSAIGAGALIAHYSYLGDCELGAGAIVGAGTVTCNFDGTNKHRTVIGEQAFVGSNCSLIAPIAIGPDAVIGAGSVVTRDVAAGAKVYGNPARRPAGRNSDQPS